MIKTTHTCDKCNYSQEESDQMWWVRLHVDHADHVIRESYPKIKRLWCRACIDKTGLISTPRTVKKEVIQPPTLEEIIIELVTDTMENLNYGR